jgi:hypothetical protein
MILKQLAGMSGSLAQKKGGLKNEGKSVEVIENKCRKNVSFLL